MGNRRELRITIEFYSDGRTVANMWKHRLGGGMVGALPLKHGEAKCHPDDKFDPQIGAMIAMARMFGDEVEYHADKEEPEHKLTDFEEDALKKGYTLVRNRLPGCTAYDGRYLVMDKDGGEGGGLHWDHRGKTFTINNPDKMNNFDRDCARKIWMESPDSVIAWKVLPDAVERKALDEGYTLCRDRYPDKSGVYDVMTEDGKVWHDLPWNGYHFGNTPRLWMNKHDNPAIAWKEHK